MKKGRNSGQKNALVQCLYTDTVGAKSRFNHTDMKKHPLPTPWAMMPSESNFPKYLPEGSGHQTLFCKLGCHSRAKMIDLPENKINSPSHSK